MDLFRFFRSMYDVGCQFVKKEDGADLKVTSQETSTVSICIPSVRVLCGLFTRQPLATRHLPTSPTFKQMCYMNLTRTNLSAEKTFLEKQVKLNYIITDIF